MPSKETVKKTTAPKKPLKLDAKTQRTLLIGGGVVAAVIAIVLLAPLLGGGDAIAGHMPANAAVYFHIDLSALTSEDVQEIVTAFQEASGVEEVEGESWQDAILADSDLSYQEDIQPWLGAQLGFVVFGEGGTETEEFSLNAPPSLLVIQSRDNASADAFLAKMVENADNQGDTVTTVDHAGTTIYVINQEGFTLIEGGEEFGGSTNSIARSGNLVVFASGEDTMRTFLDLSAADSLANDVNFKKTVAQLSGGRISTAYVNFGGYMEFISSMSGMSPLGFSPASQPYLANLESMTMGLSTRVVEEGVRFDFVTVVDESTLPPALLEVYGQGTRATNTIQNYPEDTVLFVGSASSANGADPEIIREVMGEEAYNDYIESLQLFSDQFGLDVQPFIESIGGEASFGVFPQTTGVGQYLGLGLQFMLSTNDDAAFATFFSGLNDLLASQMQLPTTPSSINGMSAYMFSQPFVGDLLAFGSGNGYGFLTTDPAQLEESGSDSFVSLAESELYQETWKSFSSSSIPVFYMNMRGFMDALSSSQLVAEGGPEATEGFKVVRPITVIAGAGEPYSNGVGRGAFIIFIER